MPCDEVLVLIDDSGRVVEWKDAAENRFGWPAEQVVGRSVTTFLRQLATADEWQREVRAGTAGLLVRPVGDGASLLWHVCESQSAAAGHDLAVLQSLLTRSSLRMHILDDRLRVVSTSTEAGEFRPSAEGMPFTELYGFAGPEDETAVAHGVIEDGRAVMNRLVWSTTSPDRQMRRLHLVSYFRLEDGQGHVMGVVATAADVTAREYARALLDRVRTEVGHRLSVTDVCREFVQALVPDFAEAVDVEVVEGVVLGGEPPFAPVTGDVLLRRVAIEGSALEQPVGDVHASTPATPTSRVLSDLQPRLISGHEPWLTTRVRSDTDGPLRARSVIVAPLELHGQVLGLVSFYRHHLDDPFSEDDLALAMAMCGHAALCVNNARQYMREWIIASTVQRRLLPQRSAEQPTLETDVLHLPGSQGEGAWFDVIALPSERTALVVGDVAGQGIASAVTMGLLRTAIHTLMALDLQPDELLARLSDTAARLANERAALPSEDSLQREPLTATCTIAVYDPIDLTLTIASAGPAKPVVVCPDGMSINVTVPEGPSLTARDISPYPVTTVHLAADSIFAMGEPAIADAVLAAAARLRTLLEGAGVRQLADLRAEIARGLSDQNRAAMVLLARTKSLAEERVMTLALPDGPEAAPMARAASRRQLEVWGVDEEIGYATELIVSELVGNAVRYGAPPLCLRLIYDQMLTCEVSDTSPGAPRVMHARSSDETGRGLFIVASLTDQWGIRYRPQGKIVWAQQQRGRPTPPV
ncbi:SpoIIE family protein phosphatase [Streptomyces sp. NPDC006173]|uniref:ATP-binding SpoIIE family protein phosphatase n=1 Tax=Streptomyces sp. NPDC006173 TaxID=3155349 RepID=UPI0033DCE499